MIRHHFAEWLARRAEAERLLRQGLSIREAARRAGVSRKTVSRQRTALLDASMAAAEEGRDAAGAPASGVPAQRSHQTQRAEAERLLKEGLGPVEVGRRLGVPKQRVSYWRTVLNLSAQPKDPQRVEAERRDPRRDEAERLLREGFAAYAVGRRLGISASTVRTWRLALGLPAWEREGGRRLTRRPGKKPALCPHPQREAGERLLELGLSALEVSRRLRVSHETVAKWRDALP